MRREIVVRAACQLALVTRVQLLSLGLDAKQVKRLVARGELERVHPGVYRLPGHPISWDQRLLAAMLAAGGSAAISFEAAAVHWRIERIDADRPHVSVVEAQRLRLRDVVVHRTRLFAPGDIVSRGPLRVTSPYRTMIDLAAVLRPDQLEDALDDAIRRRLVSVKALTKRLEIRGRRGVRGIGRLADLLGAREGKRPKASSLQNRFRRGLEEAGLPMPLEEYPVVDTAGRFIARVDFAYPEIRVFLEVDGSHHETRKQRAADVARQNRLVRAGWKPLRYDGDQVRSKIYVAEIGDILRSAESKGSDVSPRIPQKREERDER